MAEKIRYPQIPSTVWWGVRSILKKTPKITVDERLLGIQLGVQEAAARQYITELVSVGLFTEDGKATPLAEKWRLDEHYSEAIEEIVRANYPESLRTVGSDGDRQKIVSWFLREGLGQGAAGNKAATFLLISTPTPNEAPNSSQTRTSAESTRRAVTGSKPSGKKAVAKATPANNVENGGDKKGGTGYRAEAFPLNINVQIHISADAGTEQIESIFSAMKRYLHDVPSS